MIFLEKVQQLTLRIIFFFFLLTLYLLCSCIVSLTPRLFIATDVTCAIQIIIAVFALSAFFLLHENIFGKFFAIYNHTELNAPFFYIKLLVK
ncbi:hypothetical protein C4569_00435 [Candidatus Parcubacteria bacterium]|nr:MAG: hypothetical protein C4569_00435 [Candidatus Parcubacteria bacterium]